jgi:hypothetical protein
LESKYLASLVKNFKTRSSAGKVMLTVFGIQKGQFWNTIKEKGTTVNSAHYSEMLHDKLKPAI